MTPSDWPAGKSVGGIFLMVQFTMGAFISGKVVLGHIRRQTEQARRKKSVNSIPPLFMLKFRPLDLCPENSF